jgi:hypothetical protein
MKSRMKLNMMSVRTMEDAFQFALKAEEKLAKKQTNGEEVKSRSQAKARELPMKKHISLRMRLRNHTIT